MGSAHLVAVVPVVEARVGPPVLLGAFVDNARDLLVDGALRRAGSIVPAAKQSHAFSPRGRNEELCISNEGPHCTGRIEHTRRSRGAAACRSRSAAASACRTASRPSGSPHPSHRPTPTRRAQRPAFSMRIFSFRVNHSSSYSSACKCTC